MENRTSSRKTRVGLVVSDKMDKTVVVAIADRVAHPLYKKIVKSTYKLKAHDEKNECGLGDTVTVMETRPLSKTKRWRVVEIVERAKSGFLGIGAQPARVKVTYEVPDEAPKPALSSASRSQPKAAGAAGMLTITPVLRTIPSRYAFKIPRLIASVNP